MVDWNSLDRLMLSPRTKFKRELPVFLIECLNALTHQDGCISVYTQCPSCEGLLFFGYRGDRHTGCGIQVTSALLARWAWFESEWQNSIDSGWTRPNNWTSVVESFDGAPWWVANSQSYNSHIENNCWNIWLKRQYTLLVKISVNYASILYKNQEIYMDHRLINSFRFQFVYISDS